ncbi:GAF and ANTAR domain-containing protein [Streptomyces sp. NPDC059070]|uniref:GAF and ANTAR domain-containing protein n=1 Tax=Streptomyces sp. NPDC059070 TaxID=3346713 RepID=UPI00367BA35E
MKPVEDRSTWAALAWARAARAHDRAQHEAALAKEYEFQAARTDDAMYLQLAETHRRMEACHLSSARLQESYARNATRWTARTGKGPQFMSGVAEACGTSSATLALLAADHTQLAFAASDAPSQAAQDLEYMLGEGPCTDAAGQRRPVHLTGTEIEAHWPGYGPALTALGIGEVAAVPLQPADDTGQCLGALAAFDPRPGLVESGALRAIGAALARTVLLDPDADPTLYGGVDHRDTINQAAGMLAVRASCPVPHALALIKARAFADGVSPRQLAEAVISGDLNLV